MRKCSTIGPSDSAGKNVSAPTITMTPTSRATKSGVSTGNEPAVSVAALTLYDICKAVDKAMAIGGIRVIEKRKS